MENIELLRKIYIFQDLSSMELIQVNKLIHSARFEPGECIINLGDSGDEMFIIKSGKIRIFLPADDGEEETLAELSTGDHFGEIALLDDGPRSASACAETVTEVIKIDRASFSKLLESKTDMALKLYRRFVNVLCHRLRSANESVALALPFTRHDKDE